MIWRHFAKDLNSRFHADSQCADGGVVDIGGREGTMTFCNPGGDDTHFYLRIAFGSDHYKCVGGCAQVQCAKCAAQSESVCPLCSQDLLLVAKSEGWTQISGWQCGLCDFETREGGFLLVDPTYKQFLPFSELLKEEPDVFVGSAAALLAVYNKYGGNLELFSNTYMNLDEKDHAVLTEAAYLGAGEIFHELDRDQNSQIDETEANALFIAVQQMQLAHTQCRI